MGIKKMKIDGNCPYCKAKNSVVFADYYYENCNIPYGIDIPTCNKCNRDSIEIRKVNNRRYKVVEKQ